MNFIDSVSYIKQKQENFHVQIRKQKLEEVFKLKRQLTLLNNCQFTLDDNDNNELINIFPVNLLQAYQQNDLIKVEIYLDKLSQLLKKYAIKARDYSQNHDNLNYKNIESIIMDFFKSNQETVQVIVQMCGFQFASPLDEDFIQFEHNDYQKYQICKESFLILTNLAYFYSEEIITNLADREIHSRVLQSLFKRIDKREFCLKPEICSNIIDNILYFFTNLVSDPNISEERYKDIQHELLCSNLPNFMKLSISKVPTHQQILYKQTQITFLHALMKSGVPQTLEEYQGNVIYFLQLSVQIITEEQKHPKQTYISALSILSKLSLRFDTIMCVATKSIWDRLIDDMEDLTYYPTLVMYFIQNQQKQKKRLFSNLTCAQDQEVVIQLINRGILKKVQLALQQTIPLSVVKSTLVMLNNMLSTSSSQLVDVFCRKILPLIVTKYNENLDSEVFLTGMALQLMRSLRLLRINQAMTLVNMVIVIECQIFEILSDSLKIQSKILIEYLQTVIQFQDHDPIVQMQLYQRLLLSNAQSSIIIAYHQIPKQLIEEREVHKLIQSFLDMISDWEEIMRQRDDQQKTMDYNDSQY